MNRDLEAICNNTIYLLTIVYIDVTESNHVSFKAQAVWQQEIFGH